MSAAFKIELSDGRSLTAPTKDAAVELGAAEAKPGSLFGVESPRGKAYFYKRGMGAPMAYPISAKGAAILSWTS